MFTNNDPTRLLTNSAFAGIAHYLNFSDLLSVTKACKTWRRALASLTREQKQSFSKDRAANVWRNGAIVLQKVVDLRDVLGRERFDWTKRIEEVRPVSNDKYLVILPFGEAYLMDKTFAQWCQISKPSYHFRKNFLLGIEVPTR